MTANLDLDALLKRYPGEWEPFMIEGRSWAWAVIHVQGPDADGNRRVGTVIDGPIDEWHARLLAAAPGMMRAIQKLDALQTAIAMGSGSEDDETGMVMEWMRSASESLP